MNRRTVFWFTNIVGPLILLSYWRGVAAVNDPLVYWGEVPERMQSFIVPWMFVAAAGYLMMFHRFFFAWTEDEVASLHWPGKASDGKGEATDADDGDGHFSDAKCNNTSLIEHNEAA